MKNSLVTEVVAAIIIKNDKIMLPNEDRASGKIGGCNNRLTPVGFPEDPTQLFQSMIQRMNI